MPSKYSTDRWCVCTAWTYEADLCGCDFHKVVSTHDTREQAQAERDRVYRNLLQDINTEDRCWCIGVGICREPKPPYAPDAEIGKEMEWADFVPQEFIDFKEAEE